MVYDNSTKYRIWFAEEVGACRAVVYYGSGVIGIFIGNVRKVLDGRLEGILFKS